MLLAIIVVVQVLIILSVPASAWDWGTDANYNVNTYNASIVSDGAIILDAQLDHEYLSGTKITHYPDVVPYFRSDKYSSLAGNAKGEFFAYIAADAKGMYIYTQIEDSTIFTTIYKPLSVGINFESSRSSIINCQACIIIVPPKMFHLICAFGPPIKVTSYYNGLS